VKLRIVTAGTKLRIIGYFMLRVEACFQEGWASTQPERSFFKPALAAEANFSWGSAAL
jgi:hypothetical protein